MNIRNQPFVFVSDLFEGLPALQEAWDEADHGSFDFSFGDCTRSMITQRKFTNAVNDSGEWLDEEDEVSEYNKELKVLQSRLANLPDDVLIDVEENK